MKKLVYGVDYFVRYVRFPNRSNPSMVSPNDDGTYDIYLNTWYEHDVLLNSLQHEIRHLEDEHFYVETPIQIIEDQADGVDPVSAVLHPPAGMVACFHSEAALAHWITTVCELKGIRFPDGG